MTEPWVSVEQIAKHLGVTRDPTYRWIDRMALPAHRIRRLWKFKVSEEGDDWLRRGGLRKPVPAKADNQSAGEAQCRESSTT